MGPPQLKNDALKDERELVFCTGKVGFGQGEYLGSSDVPDSVHLKMLQTIRAHLTGDKTAKPRYGAHWAAIGFQVKKQMFLFLLLSIILSFLNLHMPLAFFQVNKASFAFFQLTQEGFMFSIVSVIVDYFIIYKLANAIGFQENDLLL